MSDVPVAPPLDGALIPAPSSSRDSTAVVPAAPASNALSVASSSLPSVEPPLAGLTPIPVKSTLMLINHFIVTTTTFLNHFVGICERKLNKVTNQIQRMEIVLALLEAKLNSVDYLEGNIGPSTTASANAEATTAPAPGAPSAPAAPGAPGDVSAAPPAPPAPGAPSSSPAPNADISAPAASGGVALKDDPVYRQYLKLLSYGVPKSQVRQKLQAMKLNPDVVDMDPEGPAPPHDGVEEAGALVSVSAGAESDNDDDNENDD